jgi:hypothetical protein
MPAPLQTPGKAVWRGDNPVTNLHVYIDGPYKTGADADRSATSLLGVELAARGGLYVVSAALTSHLDAQVAAVAKCLGI